MLPFKVEGDPKSAAAARRHLETLVSAGKLSAGKITLLSKMSTAVEPKDITEVHHQWICVLTLEDIYIIVRVMITLSSAPAVASNC